MQVMCENHFNNMMCHVAIARMDQLMPVSIDLDGAVLIQGDYQDFQR